MSLCCLRVALNCVLTYHAEGLDYYPYNLQGIHVPQTRIAPTAEHIFPQNINVLCYFTRLTDV